MSIVIDKDTALDLLDKAVDFKGPEHVQEECYYLVDEFDYAWSRGQGPDEANPGCIVGTALFLADRDALVSAVGWNGPKINGQLITDVTTLDALSSAGITLTPEALVLFENAQDAQDGRMTDGNVSWGDAVAFAKGEIDQEILRKRYNLL